MTYKPDIADLRESPAVPLLKRLVELGATVQFHDPYMTTWHADGHLFGRVAALGDALRTADWSILLQGHSAYDFALIATNAKRVLDTRGVLSTSSTVERL